jgi:hypothetical protein
MVLPQCALHLGSVALNDGALCGADERILWRH